jgi:hypothetical protein
MENAKIRTPKERNMKTTTLVLACLLVVMGVCVGRADTIVLQQGLNGYSGCQDSFVNTGAYSDDAAGVCYGLNRFLILNSEHFENF